MFVSLSTTYVISRRDGSNRSFTCKTAIDSTLQSCTFINSDQATPHGLEPGIFTTKPRRSFTDHTLLFLMP